MPRQRHRHVAILDICQTPLLGHRLMIEKPCLKRAIGADKPCLVTQITQTGDRLKRGRRQCIQPVTIDRMVRCFHQHDMQRLQRGRINCRHRDIIQQAVNQHPEYFVILACCLQQISTKTCACGITLHRIADYLRLVPERLQRAATVIHHAATGLFVLHFQQLRDNQPFLPFQPFRIIRQGICDHRDVARPARCRQPGKTGLDKLCITASDLGRLFCTHGNHRIGQGRQGR